jgi:hypothetical protein
MERINYDQSSMDNIQQIYAILDRGDLLRQRWDRFQSYLQLLTTKVFFLHKYR